MYRILDLLIKDSKLTVPAEINYKTQLTCILDRDVTITKGRLTNVDYKNPDNDELVLSVSVVYNDSTGNMTYPLNRTTTRTWFTHDSSNHSLLQYDKTVKLKRYDMEQTTLEGQKRRKLIVDRIFMMSIQLGYVTEAKARVIAVNDLLQSYIIVGDTAIIDNVTNTPETWLDNPYPMDPTKTLRQVMIGALTT